MNLPIEEFARIANSSIGSASEGQRVKIKGIGLPDDLEGLLTTKWLKEYGQIEAIEFYDTESICEEVTEEDIGKIPQAGFLPFGKAPNGDILVVDFKKETYPVGFIQLAEWNVSNPPSEHEYIQISDSIDCFMRRAIQKRSLWHRLSGKYNLPCDSYDV
ncbi:MAG: hypothetical protein ACSHX8_12410 [Opitutaceae bacterium]